MPAERRRRCGGKRRSAAACCQHDEHRAKTHKRDWLNASHLRAFLAYTGNGITLADNQCFRSLLGALALSWLSVCLSLVCLFAWLSNLTRLIGFFTVRQIMFKFCRSIFSLTLPIGRPLFITTASHECSQEIGFA